MIVKCNHCGRGIYRKPSDIKKENYCDKNCRYWAKNAKVVCDTCGKEFVKNIKTILSNVFCSRKCTAVFTSARMSKMNEELNPDRMTAETREKVRKGHLRRKRDNGNTYGKTYGKHTHRLVMEKMIGRKLREGEVVHHEDRDKRNNSPENLKLFASQAEHAAWHTKERYPDEKA